MCFGRSFTQKWCFGGLKTQTFENDVVIVCINYKNVNLWEQ